jgi:ferredoxin
VKIVVDFDVCMSNGDCVFAAPAVFRLDDEDFLQFDESPGESERARVEQAILACPTQAIRLEEGP